MLILDNSVLSAFVRLNLLEHLQLLVSEVLVSQEIVLEYSQTWQHALPDWITITQSTPHHLATAPPPSLSKADLSTIHLALEYGHPLASDDQNLRNFAKELGINVTGSLGLLKTMYQRKIIPNKQDFMNYIEALRQDVFLSEELYRWALDT